MQWKEIKGFEGLYEVSECGEIRNFKTKRILKQRKTRWGYLQVGLMKNNKRFWKATHRRVAESFIPNPENKSEVNHIDGNKLNNCVDNLEWCTRIENQAHAINAGLCNKMFGKHNPNAKKVLCIETGQIFNTAKEAADFIGKSRRVVARVASGYNKTAAGYSWRYI